MNKDQFKKLVQQTYLQCLIDTKKIIEEIFDKSIEFYNKEIENGKKE